MNTPLTTNLFAQERTLLLELETSSYQGRSLLDLVEKNVIERRISGAEMSNTLKDLARRGQVKLSDEALYFEDFDRLLVLRYELRQSGQMLTAQGAYLQQQLSKK